MKRLHYLVALSVVWFSLLYNIERFIEPVDIAAFAYIYTAFCALFVLFLPRLQRVPSVLLILLLLVVYLVLKRQVGYQLSEHNLLFTIVEMGAITITIVLSALIRHRLRYLQEMLTDVVVRPIPDEIRSFGTGQGQIYREIRRARRHQRPVSLLAISAADEGLKMQLNHFAGEIPLQRFLGEVQRDFIKKYINSRLANLLMDELEDSAVVTQRDDHFVTLLPEISREEVTHILKKLKGAAEEKLGLKLNVGVSTFPDRAVTFETLLEQAEAEMMQQPPTSNRHIDLIAAEVKKMSSA